MSRVDIECPTNTRMNELLSHCIYTKFLPFTILSYELHQSCFLYGLCSCHICLLIETENITLYFEWRYKIEDQAPSNTVMRRSGSQPSIHGCIRLREITYYFLVSTF